MFLSQISDVGDAAAENLGIRICRVTDAVTDDLATVKLDNSLVSLKSRNVAGIIKGSEAPDEVFIYMGHWDHLGFDTSIEGDGIYNGALDNATGTAGLIELAKAFKSLPQAPKRSIMFLAVTAEEQGLLGSAYYAANPLVPLANTVGGLNMDGLNNFGSTKDVTVVGLAFLLAGILGRGKLFEKLKLIPETG